MASDFSKDDSFVFASHKGTALNPNNFVNRGFKPALKKAGLDGLTPRITFHDLRHYFASAMTDYGIGSVDLADAMGHRDKATTERIYIHAFNREKKDSAIRAAMQTAMNSGRRR
jgi:integrase